MAYQDELPALFGELPNLVIAGRSSPMDLGMIMSTGSLPEPETDNIPSDDIMAFFNGTDQSGRGSTYDDILR